MDLDALQAQLREFAVARDWPQFHSPKNLSMALMVEAAELLEHFQWLTPEQSQVLAKDPVRKAQVADEVADVLLYLLQLADQMRIDIPQAVGQKLLKNALKHPPANTPAKPVATIAAMACPEPEPEPEPPPPVDAAHVHVLIDWENVQPSWAQVQSLVADCTHVWLLHGAQQKVSSEFALLGERFTCVPSAQPGRNALDFQLSFYCGYLASKRSKRLVILANDRGYEPMIKHALALGFDVTRLGIDKPVAAAAKADAPEPVSPAMPAAAVTGSASQEFSPTPASTSGPLKKVLETLQPGLPQEVPALVLPSAPVKPAKEPVVAKKPLEAKSALANAAELTDAQYAQRLYTAWSTHKNWPSRRTSMFNAIRAMVRVDSNDAPRVRQVFELLSAKGGIRLDADGERLHYRQRA